MRLSSAQVKQFSTFGFLSFPGLLADRAAAIIDAFEQVWKETGGGHAGRKHEGNARSCIVPFIDQSSYLSSLIDDPRIEGILASLLGDDFNYMGSDGNYYVGDTVWHSDGWHDKLSFVKIALYLDPLTRNTGALRVIPGSHMPGTAFAEAVQRDIGKSQEAWGLSQQEVPALALETNPGDVVLFNHNTKHASFGGGKARRMFTINCSQRIPETHLQTLKDYIGGSARFWIDNMYGPKMLANASPSRMVHLEQALAHQDHLPALAAKARKEMPEPARG